MNATTLSKSVLVTGANRGIGKETARTLAERGFPVVITARDPEAANETARAISADTGNPRVSAIPMDVSNDQSIREAADRFGQEHESLSVLVNNAGIYPDEDGSILEVNSKEFFETLATNTLGPLLVTRFFRPYLDKAEGGARVINLSSGLGQLCDMEHSAPTYSVSKTALNAITRQLASSLQPRGISVNSVCPGWVRTDMGGPGATRSIEEGADTVVWLADEAPADLTGQFLRDRQSIDW